MKTFMQKKETVDRKWYIIDATGLNLGRLATEVAVILMGKKKTTYTPHVDCGDYVIIINASKVNLTGNKLEDKKYYNHSRYAGGMRVRNAGLMLEKYPVEMVERSVKGMLPKGPLGRSMYRKLKVYRDDNYQEKAQKPIELKVK